jgi:hypothetical protein
MKISGTAQWNGEGTRFAKGQKNGDIPSKKMPANFSPFFDTASSQTTALFDRFVVSPTNGFLKIQKEVCL